VPASAAHGHVYKWIVDGEDMAGDTADAAEAMRLIRAFTHAQQASDVAEITRLIRDKRLPREAVPTQWLTKPQVWEALLEDMPVTAMLRNLATMTRVELLAPMSAGTRRVLDVLGDAERLRRARLHPITVLAALLTYTQGRGQRGQPAWTPVQEVVDALDAAFYTTFGHVTPAGGRWLLAVDVSGSMDGGTIAGIPGLRPRHAAAAMSLVTAAVERECALVAFTSGPGAFTAGTSRWPGYDNAISPLAISPRQRLDDVMATMRALPFGGTDCALPMLYAEQKRLEVDTFVVYTDSETWAGDVHPAQALVRYRERMGIAAKLIVVACVANPYSIADPRDGGMLDVVGFDTATPEVIAMFASGGLSEVDQPAA
jgi:60 kDa SS-A/Ro ribonucleoprotein